MNALQFIIFVLPSLFVLILILGYFLPKRRRVSFVRVCTTIVVVAALLFLLPGCVSMSDPAKPSTEAEMLPVDCGPVTEGVFRETGREGLVINTGTAPAQVCIYDKAGRLLEKWYLKGADRHLLSQDGRPFAQAFKRRFDPGCFRVEIYYFYKDMVTLFPVRIATIMLGKQTQRICTNRGNMFLVEGQYVPWYLRMGMDIPNYTRTVPTNIVPGLIQFRSPFDRQ